MMDSTNITENPTDNLDEYGVWVKKAPKASENDVSNENESLGSSKSDESAEVTDIPNSPINSDADSLSLDATEEVSLDDFLGDEALDDTVTSDDAQENKMDFSSEEEVSLDEFLDTDDKEDTAAVASDEIEEEPPLDIDLDFSDENTEDTSSQEESEPSVIADTNVASEFESVSEGKTVDLDNFDDIFSSLNDESGGASSGESENPSSSSETGSDSEEREVDLSEFDVSDNDSAASAPAETESVDLSDFGFSNDAPSESETPKNDDSSEIKMNVIADDDIPEESAAPQTENAISDIPDTFDEETAIFSEPEETSKTESANAASNDVLNQIASELAALRLEISSLKNDVEELKKAPAAKTSEPEISVEEPADDDFQIPTASANDSEGGFFGGDDDDDVIALSGDELDDILNNQDIQLDSEEPITVGEESDTEAQEPSFEGPSLEASSADDFEAPVIEDSEIEEPKVEDLDENQFEVPPEITESEPDFAASENEFTDDVEIPVSNANDSAGGFFGGDDDDDVIALSGSELDDILNTADFTEETDMTASETVDNVTDSLVEDASTDDLIGSANTEVSPTESAENDYDALFEDEGAEAAPAEEIAENAEIPSANISEEDAFAILGDEQAPVSEKASSENSISGDLREEIKSVLSYMDQLLESLPEEKITEFAQSEQFETYKKLFKELGLA